MKCSKNRLAVIVFIVTVLLLTGWAPWQRVPDLVDIDGPFIDLAGSVGDSIGNALQVYESENAANAPTPVPAVVPVLQPTPTPAVPSDITPTPVPAQDPARIIRIIVGTEPAAGPDADGGEKYIIGNTVFDEAGRVLSYIRQQPVDSNIAVIDNYAETEAFKALLSLLRENGIEFRVFDENDLELTPMYVFNDVP